MTPSLNDVISERIGRRSMLRGLAATALFGGTGLADLARASAERSTLAFREPDHVIGETDRVAEGYRADVLIRWGDRVLGDAPRFLPSAPTADAQARQFGYNNDYLGFLPLPRGSKSSDHGLLWANHEYTDPQLMFPGWSYDAQTPEQTAIEIAAHGGSIVEVKRGSKRWRVVEGSGYARRITASTPMAIAGPAAGHARLKTGYDPTGTRVLGTLNNCAGGKTPWHTVLTAEENFHGYFGGADPATTGEGRNYAAYGIQERARFPWHRSVDRFHLGREPREPNRFGWMVEVDPYDPTYLPVKRTALGRFKHEGASVVVAPLGHVVVYSGDDEVFQCLYRFVSRDRFDPERPEHNRNLLDHGTLYVARFDAQTVTWLPLVFGEGPLTPENGFESQADVLIETRRAAKLLGATPMDRPEDVEHNPVNGRVYVMLTNNKAREEEDVTSPRAPNPHGHVVELVPPGGYAARADHTARKYFWNVVLLAGNPNVAGSGAAYHPATDVWLSSPDNCAFDPQGRLWIATDQGGAQLRNRIPDGVYACDVEGPGRALVKFFYGVPRSAELCGPEFTPDGKTLFVAVQHPAEERGSTFERPSTRWPDFDDAIPPRPSVVAITKEDGGPIGS